MTAIPATPTPTTAAASADLAVRRVLVEQLTSQLAQSALPGGDAGREQVRSLFAQTLADAVASSTPPATPAAPARPASAPAAAASPTGGAA